MKEVRISRMPFYSIKKLKRKIEKKIIRIVKKRKLTNVYKFKPAVSFLVVLVFTISIWNKQKPKVILNYLKKSEFLSLYNDLLANQEIINHLNVDISPFINSLFNNVDIKLNIEPLISIYQNIFNYFVIFNLIEIPSKSLADNIKNSDYDINYNKIKKALDIFKRIQNELSQLDNENFGQVIILVNTLVKKIK